MDGGEAATATAASIQCVGSGMTRKKICVALQGGGSHGAFTWGVLDRLLEEDSLEIEAVSGTSAGAMNGAVMADALKRGGRQHARERLERFWRSISEAGWCILPALSLSRRSCASCSGCI